LEVLAQSRALAGSHRGIALQVGQLEVAGSVSAILGAQQRKQSGVLRNCNDLAGGDLPPHWIEVESYQPQFTYKWV
jgi:hypothetical protein